MRRRAAPGAKRILIVEDLFAVATDLQLKLESLLPCVVESCASSEEAELALASQRFDAAILDFQLRGSTSAALAEFMQRGRIPFCIASGYDLQSELPDGFPSVPLLRKPVSLASLRSAFQQIGLLES